jgi:hypothetical protein
MPLAYLAKAGDQAQQRGLAAAGGPEQREELVLADGDGHAVQGTDGIGPRAKDLADAPRFDRDGFVHDVPAPCRRFSLVVDGKTRRFPRSPPSLVCRCSLAPERPRGRRAQSADHAIGGLAMMGHEMA